MHSGSDFMHSVRMPTALEEERERTRSLPQGSGGEPERNDPCICPVAISPYTATQMVVPDAERWQAARKAQWGIRGHVDPEWRQQFKLPIPLDGSDTS